MATKRKKTAKKASKKKKPSKKPTPKDPAAEWIPLKQLKPWKKNPRKNDDAVQSVANSIQRFGFGAPILARKANSEVIAGHTRLKAAKQLGLKTVPVRFVDITASEAHLLALADNKLGEIAIWDNDVLFEELGKFDAADAELAGWSEDELKKFLSIEDPQPPPETASVAYTITVTCTSQEHQAKLLETLEAEGLECRAIP